ncbi:MAG: hypothetical protein WC505_07210 [Patescibacteria group bacterium]
MAYPIEIQSIKEASATQKASLGAVIDVNGSKYMYVRAVGTITANQALGRAVAEVTKANDVASSTTTSVVFTTANLTANAHRGDWLCVYGGTGRGDKVRIADNTASTLTLEDALATALGATSDIVIVSQYAVAPLNATYVIPVGVSNIAVTDDYYFWMQVSGIGLCNVDDSDTAITGGQAVIAGTDAGKIQGSGATAFSAATLGIGIADAGGEGDIALPIIILPGGGYQGGGSITAIYQN